MKVFISKYIKSEFSKNILTLFTGSVIAQAIPIIASFYLARIFSPSDFGEFGIFNAIIGISIVISTLRFEYAIVLPEKEEDAKGLLSLSISFAILFFLLATAITFLLDKSFLQLIVKNTKNYDIQSWLYFVPIAILSVACYQIFNYWSTREKTFKKNAVSKIIQTTVIVAFSILFGHLQMGARGLIMAYIIGQLASTIFLVYTTSKGKTFFKRESFQLDKLTSSFRQHKDFAYINTPHALVSSLQENGIVFLIGYFFSSAALGFYSFALRIVATPMGIVSSSLYQVFYPHAAKLFNEKGNLSELVLNTLKRMFLFGLPIFTAFFFMAPWLFKVLFGEKWLEAGEIAQILTPWLFLNFVVTPVSSIPLIVRKQRVAFIIQLFDIIFKYTTIIAGGMLGNYKMSFIFFSIWGSSLMLFGMWWYYYLSKIKYVNESN